MAATLLCALAGCTAAPARSRALFLLQQPRHAAAGQTTGAASTAQTRPVLALADIVLAPYLTGGGIVYQTGPNRIVIADRNRWAAPLATQVSGGLLHALDRGLTGVDIRRPGLAAQPDYRLVVHIERFQGRYDGTAVISGNWRLFHAGDQIIGRGEFARTTQLRTDGYTALVRALSRGWQQVKAKLVHAIGSLLTQHMAG